MVMKSNANWLAHEKTVQTLFMLKKYTLLSFYYVT